jgi:predicted TIM-barrel fold metal-dependent hydrolase
MAAAGAGGASASPQVENDKIKGTPLPLQRYEPKSMLHARETHVARSRFPVMDFHTHITFSDSLGGNESRIVFNAKPEELLPVMDRKNIQIMVNSTGGYGKGLETTLNALSRAHPQRFIVFTEPWWAKTPEPGYAKFQADEIERAHAAGARGLKVLKILGLYLRENVKTGKLVKIDDPRFDPMWETVGHLGMPVGIHTSDPEAFFLPIDRFNERYEELNAHPDWSFHGKDFPSNRELQEARIRVIQRHPKTTFVCHHVADSEDLELVGEWMDRYPNMWVELAARIGELGRQPRASRRFFEKFQDRIVFGTDATPKGANYPQQYFCDELYEIYYRFLETADEYFDYAPARIPPQGRWKIYGIELPESILHKVYSQNFQRLLKV